MRNPTVMDFMNKNMEGSAFSARDILNFLYNGPEAGREEGMPRFDWRNIFNLSDQVIRMFVQYSEVRRRY